MNITRLALIMERWPSLPVAAAPTHRQHQLHQLRQTRLRLPHQRPAQAHAI